jgi:hypothetical protein
MKIIKTKVVVEVEKEITYDICESILDSNYSEQELAEQIINDLGLIDGGIEFDDNYFSVDGERKNGSVIEVYQEGEYDMYGGPYTPKMRKPIVRVNGRDIFDQVREAFDNYGWGDDMVDISRTDIWGYVI